MTSFSQSPLIEETLKDTKENKETKKNKKKFKCELCPCSYTQKWVLSQHVRRCHKKDTPFKCSICSFAAVINSDLKRHMRKHITNDIRYHCRHCDKVFNSFKERSAHESLHTGKSFMCQICNRRYLLMCEYKQHLKSHLQKKTKCKYCRKVFNNLDVLEKHELEHSTDSKIRSENISEKYLFSTDVHFVKKCDICKSYMGTLSEFRTHLSDEHSQLFGFKDKIPKWNSAGECPICSKYVKTKGVRFSHLLSHVGILLYKCHLCDYKTTWSKSLSCHLLVHANHKEEWTCEQCSKTFPKKSQYTRHINKHRDSSSWKVCLCEICGKSYASKRYLSAHTKKAHSVNNKDIIYNCSYCDLKFNVKLKFQRHMRIHRKYTYSCVICDQIFPSKESLDNHCNIHSELLLCHVCDTEFDSYLMIQKHRQLCSMQRVCFVCEAGSYIKHGDYICLHLKDEHPSECWKCDQCPKMFASPRAFDRHLVSHFAQLHDVEKGAYNPTCDSEEEELFGIYEEREHIKDISSNSLNLARTITCECSICGAQFSSCKDLVKHESSHKPIYFSRASESCPVDKLKKERVRKAWSKVKKIKVIVLNNESIPFDPIVTNNNANNLYSYPHFKAQNSIPNNIIKSSQIVETRYPSASCPLPPDPPPPLKDIKLSQANNENDKSSPTTNSNTMSSSIERTPSPCESESPVEISDKEFVVNINMGERKVREKILFKNGRKRVVTEDFGFNHSVFVVS